MRLTLNHFSWVVGWLGVFFFAMAVLTSSEQNASGIGVVINPIAITGGQCPKGDCKALCQVGNGCIKNRRNACENLVCYEQEGCVDCKCAMTRCDNVEGKLACQCRD
jgi:hypothetical protein